MIKRFRGLFQRLKRFPGHSIKPDCSHTSGRRRNKEAEAGKSLPAVLITLAVGSLLLAPFLSFVSSRSLGSRAAEQSLAEQYAVDAGIEFGIWSIINNSAFRNQVDSNVSVPQNLPFPGSLNGYTPTITVTGLPLGTWFVRQSTPLSMNRGASLAYSGGDRIYALRGNNSRNFGYYSISADQWFPLANAPNTVGNGGALVHGGGNFLYALRGRNSRSFWRYNIASNSWSNLANAPQNVRAGGELLYTGGDHIYAFRGNSNRFWRYSISSNSWQLRANAPASVGSGSDLLFTGSGTIYAFRGRNTPTFWRYNIGSDSWTNRANTPGNVSHGGGLAYFSGSYIYALRGNSNAFWRYTIATNSWNLMTNTPANIGRGGDLLFTGATSGFAIRGGNQVDFWEFEVTPPRYDINAAAGSTTTHTRIELNGLNTTILFWDID